MHRFSPYCVQYTSQSFLSDVISLSTLYHHRNRACYQHMNDKNHWAPTFACESCTREFSSQHSADQHMNALGHWKPKFPCETCTQMFRTQNAADHYKNYCEDCGIRFQNQNNLEMHFNSKVHRGLSAVCPFCEARYTSASDIAHHLERGSCPRAPNLNCESILRAIRERDPHGVITNKQLTLHNESNVDYIATDRAYNGLSWECYICHHKFDSKSALNMHVNSPVHKQRVYHCPNSKRKCSKQFSTVAALFNHLESGSCAFMRFENVEQHLRSMLQGQKVITL
ncbi:conserved hypothetical protein [Histoplasma capsulatum var. duboisii H88]|uniref:C2H2-type domain-containing protein n=2 Tax=Ajellomyces capsulatus (strain H88) TaxID=544711 RepID=F0UQS5_AJEC8|nr:conserved hypothetical protein [Histoplasma capsulatum var. duboisii H88]